MADETACRSAWKCGSHLKKWSVQRSAVRSIAWLGVSGRTNHVDYNLWIGQHRDVATFDFTNRGAHAFRDKALQLRLDSVVLRGHDVPARLGLPGDAVRVLRE